MASSRDYIPSNDAELGDWLTNFTTAIAPHIAALGLQAADITPLTDAHAEFEGAVSEHIASQARAKGAVENKNRKRADLESIVRPLVRRINNHPTMTNEIRGVLGLNIPNGGRTRSMAGSDAPGMFLEARPGQVIVHFGTDPSNEMRNGKPSWARGCVIYRKRADETEFRMIAFDLASPYVDTVSGPAADLTYKVAYRATRENDLGPYSPEQTIAAGG